MTDNNLVKRQGSDKASSLRVNDRLTDADPKSICKVLIVDDCPEDRADIRRMLLLGSDRRYSFSEAETGLDCLHVLNNSGENLPDCLILDYHLPDYDVQEFLMELGGLDSVCCPVLVVTGNSGLTNSKKVLGLGAQDFISKNWINPERLTRSLENSIERYWLNQELKSSHKRFKAFLENSAVIAWMKDERGCYDYLSENYEKRYNVHLADWQGKTDFDIWPKQEAEKFYNDDQKVLASNCALETVEVAPNPDGTSSWWFTTKFPFKNQLGREFVGGLAVDITERILAERALQERETELTLIMDATPALISYLDIDYRYVRVNKTYENWFCLHRQQILGHTAQEIIGEKAWRIVQPFLQRAKAGERVSFDYQIPYGTGRPRWVNGNYIPDKDGDGQVKGIVIHVVDIEERKKAEQSLRQSEEFNRSLMDGSTDCIKVLNLEGRLLHMNTPGLELMEVDNTDAIYGKKWSDLWPADSSCDIEQAIARARGGDTYSFRAFCPTMKGTPKWWDVVVSPVRYHSEGQVVRILSVLRDITERKQANEALRLSQEQNEFLASLVRYSTQSVAICYLDGHIGLVNPAFEALTGYSSEELLQINWALDLTPPEWIDIEQTKLAELQSNGQPVVYEKEFIRKDGTRVSIELLVQMINDPKINASCYFAFITDITERKQNEKQLQDAQARLSLAIAELKAGYWEYDLINNDYYLSPEWKQQLGFDDNELDTVWSQKNDRLHPDDRNTVVEATEDFINGRQPTFELQFRLRHKDGSYHWIHSRGALLRDKNNKPIRLLGLNLDITDYLNNQELNERRDVIERSFRLYVASQTAAAIAHELNQPLTAVKYYAFVAESLLKGGNLNPQRLAIVLEKCSLQAQRAGEVIKHLLNLLHKGESISEPININESVQYALDFFKANEHYKTLNIEINLANDLPQVMANALQIQKVLVNLLNNALESMQESGITKGTISVTTCRAALDPSCVQVTVTDTGVGVDDTRLLKQMFQPFFTTKDKGLGMGLSISRALVEAHGGKIWAEQNAVRGLSVNFTLPFVL